MSKKWIVSGRRYCTRAFELTVVAESPHEASVEAKKRINSVSGLDQKTQEHLGISFFDEQKQCDDILIVKEVKS